MKKSYWRTEEDIREERKKEKKQKEYAAGIVELECLIMLVVIYSWFDKFGTLKDAATVAGKIVYIVILIVMIAVMGILIWATVVHMNDYRELKRKVKDRYDEED